MKDADAVEGKTCGCSIRWKVLQGAWDINQFYLPGRLPADVDFF